MLKNAKFARVQPLQKGIIDKIMLTFNPAQKGRPKMMSKILLGFKVFLISFLLK